MQLAEDADAGAAVPVDRNDRLDADLEVASHPITPGLIVPIVTKLLPRLLATGVENCASTIGMR